MGSKRHKRETKTMCGILYQKCTKCERWFEANEENFRYRSDRDTIHTICRKCEVISTSKYYREHIDEKRVYRKEYHKNHKKEHQKWSKAYYKEYIKREGIREKRCENTQQWCQENMEYRKEYTKEYNKIHCDDKAKFKVYAHQLTIEEDPIAGKNGYILVKCTYCGRYFSPTNTMISNRVSSLNGNNNSECRLYCSENCKDACPIFRQQLYPKGFKPATSREVDPLIRQMCLKRDDYICQKCEKTIDEVELHCHHIEGATQMPLLANDVDNTITLCIDCHKWVHKQKDCTYYDLRCGKGGLHRNSK